MENLSRRVIDGFYKGYEEESSLVFSHYKKLIYFSLSTLCTNKEDLDDVYQEVFIRLFKNKPEFPPNGEGIASYLVKTSRSIALNRLNKERNVDIEDKDIPISDPLNLLSEYLVPPLEEKEGLIVLYKAAFELSFDEISKIMDIPKTTLRRTYKSSLQKVKKELGK